MCRYSPSHIAAAIDLACLKPEASSVDVSVCCQKAIRHSCASVCIKPYHVPIAARLLEGYETKAGTVIGFPHGSSPILVKACEIYSTLCMGAQEIDMVLNIGALKDGDWGTVFKEIDLATKICHGEKTLLKVILETCYLKDSEIAYACECAVRAKADFVKTSTGYGTVGATPEAVKLMVKAVGDKCQVKASGGIKTYDDAELYLDLGCTRLGSSRVEELMPYYVEEI